ncbi:unnamed protein product [Heterobilharzia americana]|nr:unnamed protein product [Heterobilharzia americana]
MTQLRCGNECRVFVQSIKTKPLPLILPLLLILIQHLVYMNHVTKNRGRGDGPAGVEAPNEEGFNVATCSDGYHCTQVLEGHSGSVLCLQYIGNLLISGSSDTTVRLWDLSTGCCLNVINHHAEAVLHLRFRNNVLVTCSKDRSIAVWDMGPWPKDVQLRQVLVGHRAAVNVVDFDDKYIVSASGDRTIKVWATDTCAYVRTLTGHRRGIACLQYRDRLVVSGSSDNTIRIWDIETGVCFRVLEGHEELVRCIRFDSKRIVSGAYDGKIKVWNLKAALNPRSKPNQLCIHTLQQHTGRVFRLQFDDFQIVSSSHDDTILIWDFARPATGSEERDDGFDDGINAALASQSNCLCSLRSAAVQCQVNPDGGNSNTGNATITTTTNNSDNTNGSSNNNNTKTLAVCSIDRNNGTLTTTNTTTAAAAASNNDNSNTNNNPTAVNPIANIKAVFIPSTITDFSDNNIDRIESEGEGIFRLIRLEIAIVHEKECSAFCYGPLGFIAEMKFQRVIMKASCIVSGLHKASLICVWIVSGPCRINCGLYQGLTKYSLKFTCSKILF